MLIGVAAVALTGWFTPVVGDVETVTTSMNINKLITPKPTPNFEAEVLVPLRKAQAKAEADRVAREQAARAEQERLRQVEAQRVERESVQVSQPVALPAGSHTDWMAAAGIAQSDWGYVDYIINHESGWRVNAVNSSSGSCGLLQQLPCGKWAHTWNDPVGALIDGNNYAVSRYGSWSAAYQFWISRHWW